MYEQITAPPDVPGKNVFCFFGNDRVVVISWPR